METLTVIADGHFDSIPLEIRDDVYLGCLGMFLHKERTDEQSVIFTSIFELGGILEKSIGTAKRVHQV